MDIAIIAPSPVPFVFGGAENLYTALYDYINVETHHNCELIKVPTKENNFFELIASYEKFTKLDLKHFDMVVSTKYPSWMVSHDNHVCYMLHKLRGLYDTYHLTHEPLAFDWVKHGLVDLNKWMLSALNNPEKNSTQMADFFAQVSNLPSLGLEPEVFRFPGPLIRNLIHFLDAYALTSEKIKRYAAISKNVKDRESYFPVDTAVSVLYPPPRLRDFACGADEFFFTVSRLDKPKRIDLLVKAMREARTDIPFIIGGAGPELDYLKALAEGDERIVFVGNLTDVEIKHYYKNSLAVLFVPYDEDYGYITIEAMKSGKPVLTTTDSGGPNEFVVSGETGFSVAPDVSALAQKLEYMSEHRQEMRAMGNRAREKVASIQWSTVVDGLIGKSGGKAESNQLCGNDPVGQGHSIKKEKKKIVVAVTFPIYPPRGGGQSRVYHLYRKLAEYFDVHIVSLCNSSTAHSETEIAPGVIETKVPQTDAHTKEERSLSEGVDWIPVTDIAASLLIGLTPNYGLALARAASGAEAVVACHPYLIDVIRASAPGISLWFEAQDFEYELKGNMLPTSKKATVLLDKVKEVESRCWREADLVYTCSDQDLHDLTEQYGVTSAVKLTVPNGVSLEDVPFSCVQSRDALKSRLGCPNAKIALFMGSWHEPNIEAARYIFDLARSFDDVKFIIIGSVCQSFDKKEFPSNVIAVGTVDDEEKSLLLSAADVALNPMTSGSGSNLKMFDYFAAGLPVISTRFGARGITAVAGMHYIEAEIPSFTLELANMLASPNAYSSIPGAARALVEADYSWDVIADGLYSNVAGSFTIG